MTWLFSRHLGSRWSPPAASLRKGETLNCAEGKAMRWPYTREGTDTCWFTKLKKKKGRSAFSPRPRTPSLKRSLSHLFLRKTKGENSLPRKQPWWLQNFERWNSGSWENERRSQGPSQWDMAYGHSLEYSIPPHTVILVLYFWIHPTLD